MSRDWLRASAALRAVEAVPHENLNLIAANLNELFQSTNACTRASAYQKKLAPALSSFTDRIAVSVVKFEGSPSQVASRRLLWELAGKVTPDEQAYLEEAARCFANRCNRAAIILLWAGAMSRFHRAIEKVEFNAFNSALARITQKKGSPFNKVSKNEIGNLAELQLPGIRPHRRRNGVMEITTFKSSRNWIGSWVLEVTPHTPVCFNRRHSMSSSMHRK